jgi:hypothetical protein
MLYVVTVSLTALFLMLWVLSGNGAGWAVLVILAVGLPGSLFAAVLGAVVEISVLATVTLVASVVSSQSNSVVAVRADSGLSPVGYLLWTFVWLIYVAVITAQAMAARLLIQKLGVVPLRAGQAAS